MQNFLLNLNSYICSKRDPTTIYCLYKIDFRVSIVKPKSASWLMSSVARGDKNQAAFSNQGIYHAMIKIHRTIIVNKLNYLLFIYAVNRVKLIYSHVSCNTVTVASLHMYSHFSSVFQSSIVNSDSLAATDTHS